MRRACALVVRAWALDESGNKIPSLPANWSAVYEAAGWCTVRRADTPGFLHVWLAVEQGANAAWFIAGPRAWVDAVVAVSANAWATLPELRADNGPVATAVKNAWAAQHGGTTIPTRMAGFDDDDGEESAP